MKYFVEFIYPGIIVSETSRREICFEEYPNPDLIKLPEQSFGFRFGRQEEVERGGEILTGKFHVESGWYFVGEKQNQETVAVLDGIESFLYKNMQNNNFDFIVRTKFGQAIPLDKKDVVL